MPTAYFVDYPRRIEDLQVLHALDQEKTYEVIRRVALSAINYENFITDMVADRAFLEDTSGTGDGEEAAGVVGLLRRFGHALHHGDVRDEDIRKDLTDEEYAQLEALLTKIAAGLPASKGGHSHHH